MQLTLAALDARPPTARRGAPSALTGVSLEVEAGEQVAIIGPSGAGKTTLLHCAAAALRPSAGSVRIGGVDPWTLPRRELTRLRGRLYLAPQVPPLPPRQRVVTAVLAGRLPVQSLARSIRSLFHPTDIPAAHAALERLDLGDKLFERVDRLSGGERQRVGLARALLAPATLWLIDEPLSSLDPARAAQAMATLIDAARVSSRTLVATLHDVDIALASFPRIVGLRDGRIVFDLPPRGITRERLAELYGQEQPERASARPAWPGETPRLAAMPPCR
ncbi:MAG: ATP-binding cassette domain-containing protein [Proteobacteria bacterium]|nr:ATP-binding cassette domain-containing protein [Pseudomonadota bacterium]